MRASFLVLILLTAFPSGCFEFEHQQSPTSPDTLAASLIGEWKAGTPASTLATNYCGDVKWRITSQQGANISGTFEATCAGGVKLAGTGSAVVDGNLQFQASGTATTTAGLTCPFTATGTGNLQADSSIAVKYTVDTCIGKFDGNEVLRR